MHPDSTIFTLLANKASEIETELKHINRWGDEPLPPEKFEDMGAFGSNTMTFEQWLQYFFHRCTKWWKHKGDLPVRVHCRDMPQEYLVATRLQIICMACSAKWTT